MENFYRKHLWTCYYLFCEAFVFSPLSFIKLRFLDFVVVISAKEQLHSVKVEFVFVFHSVDLEAEKGHY
jgi:hypothetical protein